MIRPVVVHEILEMAQKVIAVAIEFCKETTEGNENRTGGYFCLLDRKTQRICFMGAVLDPPIGESKKYFILAKEKAMRLASCENHVSSWQSRKIEDGKYGGAIRGNRYIFSFEGLPELFNEGAMLVTTEQLGEIDDETVRAICVVSDNHIYRALRQKFPEPSLNT